MAESFLFQAVFHKEIQVSTEIEYFELLGFYLKKKKKVKILLLFWMETETLF